MKTIKYLFAVRVRTLGLFATLFFIVLIMFSCTKGEDKNLSSSNELVYLSVENHPEINLKFDKAKKEVELLIPYNSSLSIQKVKLKLNLSEYATTNIDHEKEYDLTTPLIIKVVAEDHTTATYTLHSKKCEGGKSALLVSDIQKGALPVFREASFFTNSNIVIDKAFYANIPIYYIMDASVKGTSKYDLPEVLHYYDIGKFIDKNYSDAFKNTTLHRDLLLNGISKVYVIGLASMGCVLGTCNGSKARKYDLTLVSDAHDEPSSYWEFKEEDIEKCNQIISNSGVGQLVTAEELEFK